LIAITRLLYIAASESINSREIVRKPYFAGKTKISVIAITHNNTAKKDSKVLTLCGKRKYIQIGQKRNIPMLCITVLPMNGKGVLYGSINENSTVDDEISCDGITSPARMNNINNDKIKDLWDTDMASVAVIFFSIYEINFREIFNISGEI